MGTLDLTMGDPTLVEAAGPSVTAERMMVLKPFVTTAYKQRMKAKAVGAEDPWSTPAYVLRQAVSAHGRNMRELSELAELNRRMKVGPSMVRLQAEDYIGQRADVLLVDSDDEASDGGTPRDSASDTTSTSASTPNTPKGPQPPRLALPKRKAGGGLDLAGGGGAGGGASAGLRRADGNHDDDAETDGSVTQRTDITYAEGLDCGEVAEGSISSRPLPPMATQIGGPAALPSEGRRVEHLMSQLRQLERGGGGGGASGSGSVANGGRQSAPGSPGGDAASGHEWAVRTPRPWRCIPKDLPPPAEPYCVKHPMTPVLTDAFVNSCLADAAQPAGGSERSGPPGRFSSPGDSSARGAGAGHPMLQRDGLLNASTGPAAEFLRSFRIRRPSLDIPPTTGTSAAAVTSPRSMIDGAAVLSPTSAAAATRVAERWMHGRRFVQSVNGAAGATTGSSGLQVPTPPRPRGLDSPIREAMLRFASPASDHAQRSPQAAASVAAPGSAGSASGPGGVVIGGNGGGGGRMLAVVVAAAKAAAEEVGFEETDFAATHPPNRDVRAGAAAGAGAAPAGGNSDSDCPSPKGTCAATLFRVVTGTVPVGHEGTPVDAASRPIRTIQMQLQQNLFHNAQTGHGTSATETLGVRAANLLRRISSSSNLELILQRCRQGGPNKLPKLEVSFTTESGCGPSSSFTAESGCAPSSSSGCGADGGWSSARLGLLGPSFRKAGSPGEDGLPAGAGQPGPVTLVRKAPAGGSGAVAFLASVQTQKASSAPQTRCQSPLIRRVRAISPGHGTGSAPPDDTEEDGEGNGLASKMRCLFSILGQ